MGNFDSTVAITANSEIGEVDAVVLTTSLPRTPSTPSTPASSVPLAQSASNFPLGIAVIPYPWKPITKPIARISLVSPMGRSKHCCPDTGASHEAGQTGSAESQPAPADPHQAELCIFREGRARCAGVLPAAAGADRSAAAADDEPRRRPGGVRLSLMARFAVFPSFCHPVNLSA